MNRLGSPSLRRIGIIGFWLLCTVLSQADSVDDTITSLMAKRRIPGLSLAIIQEGKIVKARGYGTTEAGETEPVTTDTLFQAGSISKAVTAMGVLALVQAGKLDLDADVNRCLRSWHVPENEFTKTEKVTLRRLLSHSAGLTVHGFGGYPVDAPVPSLVQVLDGAPPANSLPIRVNFVPGSQWRYSGGGYTIAQLLIIDVTGKAFPDFMRRTVLEPLGMQVSSYEQPLPASRAEMAATGCLPGGRTVPGRWHVYPEMAAAGLWTTASDLARFAIAVQQAYAGSAESVISEATAKEMLTVQRADDGLGVFLQGHPPAQRFWHNGRDEGFDAMMTAYVATGQGAVVMINANDSSGAVTRIIEAIADAYGWPDYPHYRPPAPIEDRNPEVTTQLKEIFAQAKSGKYDADLYTPKLAALIATFVPGQGTDSLVACGELKKVELLNRRTVNGTINYRYRFIYEKDTMKVNCTYNSEGKIAALSIQPE